MSINPLPATEKLAALRAEESRAVAELHAAERARDALHSQWRAARLNAMDLGTRAAAAQGNVEKGRQRLAALQYEIDKWRPASAK